MPRYVYDHRTGNVVEVVEGPRPPPVFPAIQRDHAPYVSPATGKVVDGRYARREDLKRSNCREVDPSEKAAPPIQPDWVKDWRADRGIHRSNPNE